MTKIALITTTINVPDVLTRHARSITGDHELDIIVAGDVQTPIETRAFVSDLGGTYIGVTDETAHRWSSAHHIGTRSIQRRNLALLHALTLGPDVVVTIDDDNVPLDGGYLFDFVRGLTDPIKYLTSTSTGWYNPGQLLQPAVTHRGFPINQRHQDITISDTDDVHNDARVGVVAGLCIGDPDIDAIERIVNRPHVTDVALGSHVDHGVVLDRGTWAPFNTQNTAYTWDVAPLMQCLVGVGRYDDIWMSYVARCVMDALGYHVRYGLPIAVQDRNDHNLVTDLRHEYGGYVNTDNFVTRLREVSIDRTSQVTVIDALEFVYDHLHNVLEYDTRSANVAWLNDVRVAVNEGSTRRATRARTDVP